MEHGVGISKEPLANPSRIPSLGRSIERHVEYDGSADNVPSRNAANEAAVVRVLAVVAHRKIAVVGNLIRQGDVRGLDALGGTQGVRLAELLSVYPDRAIMNVHGVSGQADHALHAVGRVALDRRAANTPLPRLPVSTPRQGAIR